MAHASGTFEVKMAPVPLSDVAAATGLARMSLAKVFLGQLEAASEGEFLSAMGTVKGSAGYVALERVTGLLAGKTGGFVLQHSGTMNRGVPELRVTVVPDSGTGELTGLSGSMRIDITDGKHFYEFDYELAD